jgi:hypothetical protein
VRDEDETIMIDSEREPGLSVARGDATVLVRRE